ncbi:hypothetical protein JGH11_15370 [Dysgonomonas sp. Marseille-P4677]|uniref:hypothetical protein n=1 Tax=Dysgonomonas sp. Marseille-P4677 TaxID=2364790 RepID=UPI0019136450|nr:hypothetical protein [Dysgonomonas sp. Marseille-P4677]MBK5722255.1 hypothetical protein [Dysgonomonas sp. Marseille-P4677]
MKTSFTIVFMLFVGLLMTGCQNDNLGLDEDTRTEGKTSVKFELDASTIGYDVVTKATQFSPTYTKEGFSIYAFRQVAEGTDYVFEKTVSLANLSYSATSKKLTGSDLLTIGVYKFLPVYGLANQSDLLTIPTWNGSVLGDNYTIGYNAGSGLSEIFLPVTTGNTDALTSYEMGLTSTTNPTVQAKLQRAVSRVDIMFIKAMKSTGEEGETIYTETPYPDGKDVFGKKMIKTVQLRYKGLNNLMSFFGNNLTTTPSDANINLDLSKNIILIGEHPTETTIGKNTYLNYDNISSNDLIYGGAHILGNFLLPNNNTDKTTSLELYIEPEDGLGRTINISYDDEHKLPVERNKVTIVKVYVLDEDPDNPEPPIVFTTKVNFEVEIESVWDGSNEVTGEIN